MQSNLVATSLSCCTRLVHLLLPICCKMFYFSIVGFYTNCRVDQPIWVCSCTSRGNILFFSDPVCILSITPSTSRRLVDPTRHSTSPWAARGTLHCRENSRAKAHSAKENEADAAATSPGDDPRRRKVGHQRETCVTASVDV